MIDHDAAMRIADEAQHGYDYHFPAESVTLLARAYKDVVRRNEKLESALNTIADNVPDSWLDPLLTGPYSIGKPPWDCPKIEELLRRLRIKIAVAARAATTKEGE